MPHTSTEPEPFRIAIIGGAIGGLFAALSIHQQCREYGIQIDVYEQATQYREIGNGVGIGVNASRLLHKVGIGEACNAVRGWDNGIWFTFARFDDGTPVMDFPEWKAPDENVHNLRIARSELLDIMIEAIKEKGAATLHTSKKCKELKDIGDRVQISFEDGTLAEANIVVGCDGIHSAVRANFVQDKPLYSGKIAYRAVVPTASLPSPWPYSSHNVITFGPDKHFLIFPISKTTQLNIVAFVTKREDEIPDLKESWTSVCDKRELEADFAEFNDTVQAMIRLMPDKPSKWRINDREPLPQWYFWGGKVVLLGDAAHATTPHQGAGAGQAIEDGYVLSRALADFLHRRGDGGGKGLEAWVDLYQRQRLPRAQEVTRTSRIGGDLYELRLPEFRGKSYDECIPIMKEKLDGRMNWIWKGDVDGDYNEAREALLGNDGVA